MAKKQKRALLAAEIAQLCTNKGYNSFSDYIPIAPNKWGATHVDFVDNLNGYTWLYLRKLEKRFGIKHYTTVIEYTKLNADDKRLVEALIREAPDKETK